MHALASMRARAAASAALAAAVLVLPACHSLGTQPPKTPVPLAGNWHEDATLSDDFDRKLDEAITNERNRMRGRRGQGMVAGGGAGGGGGGGSATASAVVPALPVPHESVDREHKRLADDLRPPASLQIATADDTIEIIRDAEPVRRFRPGQTVSRIDGSGAANVSSGWDQRVFVIEAHYTDKATRSWRFEIDGPTDTLRLRFEASDPEFGHLKFDTVYRRAP